MDNCKNNCSTDGLDYVYSHFSGIYFMSTLVFLIYCGVLGLLKIKIFVPKPIVIPGFLFLFVVHTLYNKINIK